MASSFGGTIKLTGESEYRSALRSINSNLKAVSSELKFASAEFSNNGQKVSDLRIKKDALNKKIQEEQNIIKVCTSAIKNFTEHQVKSKLEIDKLKNSLETEKKSLEQMKNATVISSSEIEKQEKLIASLEKQLISAERAYESNSRTINDYQTKLNNAKTECSNLSKELQNSGEKANSSATGGYTVFKNVLANLTTEVINAGISALKTLGDTFINVGKQAVDSYANYEQLVGGIETLFKDSASVVEDYANTAYQSAGISANEYMETVTSFSASLLQSLDNDTAKTADVANMAIIDMADNANKMGTSMESIQTAYQGFAKQNYTMLDNLKLGYGGTKTEMERLLKDATKLSGVKYDIDSLNDVYQAIHIIQNELGVTGTTALEASTTISGSLSSMKSAWSNLLTGIADSNANLGGLVDNLVGSVKTFGDNIMPVIQQVVSSLPLLLDSLIPAIVELSPTFGNAITQMLPQIVNGIVQLVNAIIPQLPTLIQTLLPALIQGMVELANGIIASLPEVLTTLAEMLPTILENLSKGFIEVLNSLSEMMPTLIPVIVDGIIGMLEVFNENFDQFLLAGGKLILGIIQGLIASIPSIIDNLPTILTAILNFFTAQKLVSGGIALLKGLGSGLIEGIPNLIKNIPSIISNIVSAFKNNGISGFKEVGVQLIKGLWNGISSVKDWVIDKIKGFGDSILSGIKSFFGIHSPSTVFRDAIGVNLAKGIGVGFQEEMQDVNKVIKSSLPTDFNLDLNTSIASRNMKNNLVGNTLDNQLLGTANSNFSVTINNNSKYTSPSENARLLRQQLELYNLKYGRTGA